MTPWASRIRNEKGVALPLALFALVMLSGLLLAFLSMAGMEPSIAANLGDVTRGRYVADAGIEWAYDQLVAPAANWTTLLTTNVGVMTPVGGQTLPGLPATFGTFTVQVRNDIQATDTALTGVAPDAGPANGPGSNDANGVVIVTATGTLNAGTPNQVQRQIQVVVRRLALPPLPAPLNFPGLKANVNPGGTAHLHTNGVDTNRDGSNGSGPLKFGISTPSGINPSTGTTFEKSVEDSLTRHHKNEMTGRDQTQPCCVAIARGSDVNCPCEGERTIVPQDLLPSKEQLTPQKIADFLSQVKASGAVNVAETTSPGQPLVVTDGQPTQWQGGPQAKPSINLGTVAKPTITYIKGRPDQAGKETVRLEGTGTNPDGSLKNSGAGILVVEDAYLEISGSFRWDGVILITGKDVGVTFKLGSRAFIYGGMVVNETSPTDNGGEMLIEQNAHGNSSVDQFTTFFASQQNLDMVQNMPGLVRTSSWREN